MKRRLVIDTDIGTDVDDLWTVAMIPALDDVELAAISVVYGDTELRARLAAHACDAMGIDVPIHRGREDTLSGKEIMWAGHEGEGVDGLDAATYEPGDAVDVLVDLAAATPNGLDVVAIGPLTNIASAMQRDPSFATNLRHLTVMGGEFSHGWPEHNFSSDVTATATVLASGAPMTIMPLDQTLRVQLDRADVDAIARAHTLGPLMADQAERFWRWLAKIVPGSKGDVSSPHDPLALLTLVEPSLFEIESMRVEISEDGRIQAEADASSPIGVVRDFDVEAVHARLMAALGAVENI